MQPRVTRHSKGFRDERAQLETIKISYERTKKSIKDIVHKPQTTSDQKYLRFSTCLTSVIYILLVVLTCSKYILM